MFCAKCGTNLSDSDNFCLKCGAEQRNNNINVNSLSSTIGIQSNSV